MANEFKYENQVWGEPITGERLSTNGYYTGQQVGTVMQDASVSGNDVPYAVEAASLHVGTLMQDAIVDSMPTVVSGD